MKNKNMIIVIAAIIIIVIVIIIVCMGIININQNDDNNFINSPEEYSGSEVDNMFANMSYATIDVTKDLIRTMDSGIEPYGVFVMLFSYDSERPELGFKSPSGKTYYTDCQSDIEGGNNEFNVSASDFWTSVALPAEEGTWYVYYDKKTNESVEYSIIDENNEYEDESNNINEINEANFEEEDIESYEQYSKFQRKFSLNIPNNYSFDDDMHNVITNDIANIINQGEDVEFAGYSPNNAQVTIYVNILKADSSEDVTNKVLDVAYKSRDKWNSIYNSSSQS